MFLRKVFTASSTHRARRFWCASLVAMVSAAGLLIGGTVPNPLGGRALAANSSSPYAAMTTMNEGSMQMQVLPPSGKAPTWQEVSTVYTELNAAKAATAKYRTLATALADGYYTAPILQVAEQGYHYFNTQYSLEWRSGHYDYAHPPVLVYNKVNGKMVLSGLMYLVPWNTTPQQLASIFPPSMAGWHRHINNCVLGDDLNGTLLPYHTQATCAAHGGAFHAAAFGWMTHAWIWAAARAPVYLPWIWLHPRL